MGLRGPLPTPPHLTALRGNPGQRRLQTAEGVPVEAPSRPPWLRGEAAREWARVVGELRGQGRLARTDRAVLVAHCVGWARFAAVEQQLAGYIDVGSKGQPVEAALVGVWLRFHERLVATSRELGLHVTARLRLPPPAEPVEEDPLDALRRRVSSLPAAGPPGRQ